jgi:uncharacterized protein YndB with AHSA1/START domain
LTLLKKDLIKTGKINYKMATNISTLKINATRQKVWDTLTKPEFVKLWQYGSELLTSWEVGSDIKFSTAWEGKVFEQWGKVLEVNATESLKYSLFAPRPNLEDKPENYFLMSYVLTDENGQTKLEIIQEDNRPHATQEAPQGEENPILKLLKQIAETK